MSWLASPPLPPPLSSSSLLQVADHRIIGNSINHRDEHNHHHHHQWISSLPEHTKQQLQTQLLSMKATWISFLTTIKSSSSSSSSLSMDYPSRDSGIYVLAVLQQISSKVSKVMSENTQLMQGILIMMMIMMMMMMQMIMMIMMMMMI